jgi:hypothetical protein
MGLHLKKNYSKVLPLTVNYTANATFQKKKLHFDAMELFWNI